MSKWFEYPVMRFLVVLTSVVVLWGSSALAQTQENAQNKSTETTGQDSEKPAGAAVERAMISTGLDSASIARNWPDSTVWLEPPEEDRVLTLFEPEAETPAKGALVVLADEGQSPASGVAGALRQPMARAGWAVMVLGLEAPPYAVQQARRHQGLGVSEEASMPATDAEGADNTAADESQSVMIDVMADDDVDGLADQYRARIQKNLAAAVGNLVDRGYSRVAMAGVGRAAGHVTRAATVGDGSDVSAVIWIAPRFEPSDAEALTTWLEGAGSLKVLELHSARSSLGDGRMNFRSPKQREAAFKRAGITGYSRQPVAMAEAPEPREAPALTNRISAWLATER